jgi:hypothetical protein
MRSSLGFGKVGLNASTQAASRRGAASLKEVRDLDIPAFPSPQEVINHWVFIAIVFNQSLHISISVSFCFFLFSVWQMIVCLCVPFVSPYAVFLFGTS